MTGVSHLIWNVERIKTDVNSVTGVELNIKRAADGE